MAKQPVKDTRSLSQQAYEQIRALVITCELPPGRHFTEAQMIQHLGIGKTPVREALSRLIQEQLIRSKPRHGYQVVPLTLQDVIDLFELRKVLESAAACQATPHVDVDELQALHDTCIAAFTCDAKDRLTAFTRANREFHAAIAYASGNRRLAESVLRAVDDSERILRLTRGDQVGKVPEEGFEHAGLLEAFAARDAEAAAAVMTNNLEIGKRIAIEFLVYRSSMLLTPMEFDSPSK